MCFYTEPSRAFVPLLLWSIPANVLYLLGPVLESYLFWIGLRKSWMRWVIWGIGVAISILAARQIAHELLMSNSGSIWGDPPSRKP